MRVKMRVILFMIDILLRREESDVRDPICWVLDAINDVFWGFHGRDLIQIKKTQCIKC